MPLLKMPSKQMRLRSALTEFLKGKDRWEGSAAELQIVLDDATHERIRKSRFWPKTPAGVGNGIKRAKQSLEHKGFTIHKRHSGARTITIIPPKKSQQRNNRGDNE
jgi:hypothetical protein